MLKTSLVAALLSAVLAGAPALAQEAGQASIPKQSWSFAGPFGKFDVEQLQRGFQVFREVCSNCHSVHLLAFRNLAEEGGPSFTEGQVKALAAEYDINDSEAPGGTRKGVPADHWPNKFATDAEAREAFAGAVPPDLSVMAKARGITDPFPNWVFNYFTAYAEGGPDYVHALLLGYQDPPPDGFTLPDGRYYNAVFPGHAIAMPPPLSDGLVAYTDGTPQTADQYARDVAAFLMWMAEPHMGERKSDGFRVIIFLILFAGLMWFVKDRLWRPIHHHNPSAADVASTSAATPPTRRDLH